MTTTINASTSAGLVNTADTSGILQLQTAGTTAVTVDASQNVGIGTTSPAYKLSVNSSNGINSYDGVSGKGRFVLGDPLDSTGYVGMYRSSIGAIGTAGNELTIGSLSAIGFTTGGTSFSTQTERMRIDSSGYVGIGTASPNTRLVVQASTGTAVQRILNTVGVNTYQMSFNNSVGEVGTISTGSGTTAYNTSSDYRLKENVTAITNALDKVSQLKPVNWTWKVDGSDGQGFIAHELQAVCPQAVTGEKDAVNEDGSPKYQGVDTSFLVATLTAAIQEQQTIIKTQSESIDDLKARITALEGAK